MLDKNKKYAILGLARSGIAAAKKLHELGLCPFISELSAKPLDAETAEFLAGFPHELGVHSEKLFEYDCWIVSPGIPLDVPIIKEGKRRGIELISEIEFGYRIKAEDSKIIAVTGSNGKSTTVSLVHHILKNMGKSSILAGNIGAAFSSFPIQKPGINYIILEISSFQLDLINSFKPEVAALLNITPDHLNRYDGFDDYALSKTSIFKYQSESDFGIINKDCVETLKHLGTKPGNMLSFSIDDSAADAFIKDRKVQIGQDSFGLDKLLIKGPHNHQNLMAALLIIKALGLELQQAYEAALTFPSLVHRLEYVTTINGISFYNDSKATNTDSVRCALKSFERPIRLILGGSDKGEDFSLLTDELKEHTAKIYITGDTIPQMREAWQGKLPMTIEEDFAQSVRRAFEDAQHGESVVLSPACASFDRFSSFEERGDYFKKIVWELKSEKEQI
ncbi:MAG: UDP-N-acetylmuramoyl-L-alanine--D-glutamate ligase [Candidatus Cloacimonadaceae bacterium]